MQVTASALSDRNYRELVKLGIELRLKNNQEKRKIIFCIMRKSGCLHGAKKC